MFNEFLIGNITIWYQEYNYIGNTHQCEYILCGLNMHVIFSKFNLEDWILFNWNEFQENNEYIFTVYLTVGNEAGRTVMVHIELDELVITLWVF